MYGPTKYVLVISQHGTESAGERCGGAVRDWCHFGEETTCLGTTGGHIFPLPSVGQSSTPQPRSCKTSPLDSSDAKWRLARERRHTGGKLHRLTAAAPWPVNFTLDLRRVCRWRKKGVKNHHSFHLVAKLELSIILRDLHQRMDFCPSVSPKGDISEISETRRIIFQPVSNTNRLVLFFFFFFFIQSQPSGLFCLSYR